MIMDLQDVDETLKKTVARSNIRLFGSHDGENRSVLRRAKMLQRTAASFYGGTRGGQDDGSKESGKEDEQPRTIVHRAHGFSSKDGGDVAFADSDSELELSGT
jgi:hypothetical protein